MSSKLVPEMPDPGEDHRHIVLIDRLDDLLIPNRSARLNRASRTSVGRGNQTVGKGKQCFAGHDRALEVELGFARFPHADT